MTGTVAGQGTQPVGEGEEEEEEEEEGLYMPCPLPLYLPPLAQPSSALSKRDDHCSGAPLGAAFVTTSWRTIGPQGGARSPANVQGYGCIVVQGGRIFCPLTARAGDPYLLCRTHAAAVPFGRGSARIPSLFRGRGGEGRAAGDSQSANMHAGCPPSGHGQPKRTQR